MTASQEDIRYGRQTPTKSFILEYRQTRGQEALDFYNKSDRTAMEWQEQLMYDIMATNADGLWTHTSFGFSVPRRNGKSEILVMREVWGLIRGEKILHTAHLAQTAHSTFERLCKVLTATGYVEKDDFKSYRRLGAERIEMVKGNGEISFRTRTVRGALGEGFDLLIIDEDIKKEAKLLKDIHIPCRQGVATFWLLVPVKGPQVWVSALCARGKGCNPFPFSIAMKSSPALRITPGQGIMSISIFRKVDKMVKNLKRNYNNLSKTTRLRRSE